MYKLADVVNNSGERCNDMLHIIGKEFDAEKLEVGKQGMLNNISDSHIYRRVVRTPVVKSVIKSIKELKIFTGSETYVLEKV